MVDGLTFYTAAIVNGQRVTAGGHVTIEAVQPNKPTYIAEVVALFEDDQTHEQLFHARWFARATETVLGETSDDPKELVVGDDCEDVLLSAIVQVITVEKRIPDPAKWKAEGGAEDTLTPQEVEQRELPETPYWYRYLYRVRLIFTTGQRTF